jgi:molybdopterin-binding protein
VKPAGPAAGRLVCCGTVYGRVYRLTDTDETVDPSLREIARKPTGDPPEAHARNMSKGKIAEVKKGQTTAHVRIDIGGSIVTSSITNEAVDELKLKKGDKAYAVIKATDVMVGLD